MLDMFPKLRMGASVLEARNTVMFAHAIRGALEPFHFLDVVRFRMNCFLETMCL